MSLAIEAALEPVTRLTKDLANAAATLSKQEARYLVDSYYAIQENRISASNQTRACTEAEEPHSVIEWLAHQNEGLENQIKRALDKWTEAQPMGRWAKSICGIGPVLSAGLLAHIDIEKAPTVGHIWRFAGLDPTQKWVGSAGAASLYSELGEAYDGKKVSEEQLREIACTAALRIGTNADTILRFASQDKNKQPQKMTATTVTKAMARRPYNASLKTLCAFKIGESFVKVQNNESDIYGKLYVKRKVYESERNERGEMAGQAARILTEKKFSKSTDAFKHLSAGKLPPAQIHARARRWAVKLFLSHYHEEAYFQHYGKDAPASFAHAILGHAHYIPRPTLPALEIGFKRDKAA